MASNLPVAATRASRLSRPEVLATFFQGLSDPTRVRILELLAERPRTVTELQHELGLAQGRISSHLACLRWCGYVLGVADGRFNRYQLVDPRVREILADAIAEILGTIALWSEVTRFNIAAGVTWPETQRSPKETIHAA